MKAIKKFLMSFKYAFCGLWFCIKTGRNFRVHTVAAAVAVYLCLITKQTVTNTAIVLSLIAIVLSLECINTALEQVCDEITLEKRELIKRAKDASAAAVLVSAIISLIVGVSMFFNTETLNAIATPLNCGLGVLIVIISFIYIFYEDIFKNDK